MLIGGGKDRVAKFARAICTLERDTLLPEDRAVNVMHFDGDDSQSWAEDQDDLAGRIHTFYNAIGSRLSANLNGTLTVQIYDLAEPEPRVPKYEQTWTDIAPGVDSLPEEVAVAITLHADVASGASAARRRGRIYVGPLATSMVSVVSGRTRPLAAALTTFRVAMEALATGPDPGDFRLAVFSPTTLAQTGSLDQAFNDVTAISTDDAFDTIRSRGPAPTARVSLAVT